MNLAERRKKAEAEWENTKRLGLEDITYKPWFLLTERCPWVYLCLNKNETVIYVGRTTDIARRTLDHSENAYWWKHVGKVLVAKVESETDMAIYEIYYINKYRPEFNRQNNFKDSCSLEMPELNFKEMPWTSL